MLPANAAAAQNFEKNIPGVRLGAGVVWKKIYFGLNYDFGCLNMLKDAGDDGALRNNCFSISAGYNF